LWLGGNDLEKEGKWRWSGDDSKLSYKSWDINSIQPNGGTIVFHPEKIYLFRMCVCMGVIIPKGLQ
jgi:hypothetical protein